VILIGELDDWTPARDCSRDMARRSGEGAPVKLIVYPDAYHAFNFQRAKPTVFLGHRLEYNEAADRAAWTETVTALHAAFGR
jgi:dienelactone hydrolase